MWVGHSERLGTSGVTLDLSGYQPIPEAGRQSELIEIPIASLQPTQWCIGLAEVWARQEDFAGETRQQRQDYLKGKPVPLVRSAAGEVWMVDRHHRLRALLGLDSHSTAWGYVIAELPTSDRSDVLRFLEQQGWLYLIDGRGAGPRQPMELPRTLLDLEDDPYRSLVWKRRRRASSSRSHRSLITNSAGVPGCVDGPYLPSAPGNSTRTGTGPTSCVFRGGQRHGGLESDKSCR